MTERAAGRLKSLGLILLAVFFAQALYSGRLVVTLGPGRGWLAVLTTGLLILIASSYSAAPLEAPDDDRHPSRGRAWALLLLAVPLVLGLLSPVHVHDDAVPGSGWLGAALGEAVEAAEGVLYLAPASGEPPALWLMPLEGGSPRQVFAPPGGVLDYDIAPGGSYLAASVLDDAGSSDIWLVGTQGANPRRLTTCAPSSCSGVAYSPRGDVLAYERREPGAAPEAPARMWLYDLASGESAPLFEDERIQGYDPRFSPDGSQVALYDTASQSIRVTALDTGESSLIGSQLGEVGAFSPDGESLVFPDIRAVGRQYFPELWLVRVDAPRRNTALRGEAQEDFAPAWSPDGGTIAFASRRIDRTEGFASQLMLYDVESGTVEQLTDDTRYNQTAFVWHASGERLLVQRFELSGANAGPALWVYELATGEMRLLVEDAFAGQWTP